MKELKINRQHELETKIVAAAQSYYVDGTSELSDEEFDALVDELRRDYPDSFVLQQTGWGYDVSKDTTPGEKYPHKYVEAGSLEKARTYAEISKELKGRRIGASLKLDGCSAVLYYENGQLTQALTRGDGKIGIDITAKVLLIHPELSELDSPFTGAVRGEIMMDKSTFNNYKMRHPEAKNPRNSTSGLINAKKFDPKEIEDLHLIMYNVTALEEDVHVKGITLEENYDFLQANFPEVVPYCFLELDPERCEEQMNELRAKWYGDLPADGIVLSNTLVVRNTVTHGLSPVAQAFKFESQLGDTVVDYVEWNMTKSRYAFPRVHLRAVQLAGTNVEWATGYNADNILKSGIGRGAKVVVEKRGEIIPAIVRVDEVATPELPTNCPVCGSELAWEGVHLKCINEDCSNAREQDLLMWVNNIAPLDNFGDALRLKYIYQALGEDADIKKVMNGSLRKYLMPFAVRSAQAKLFSAMVEKLLNGKVELKAALCALNIPRLGELTAAKLADNPEQVDAVLKRFSRGEYHCLEFHSIVGPATAESITRNYAKFLHLLLVRDRIDWTPKAKVTVKGKVAITGKLSVKREQFIQELNSVGYQVGDISKDTDFLITDNPDSASEKNKKADKLGITKITECEFRKQYLGG